MNFTTCGYIAKYDTVGGLIKSLKRHHLLEDSIVFVIGPDEERLYSMFDFDDLKYLLSSFGNSSYYNCEHCFVSSDVGYIVDFYQIFLTDKHPKYPDLFLKAYPHKYSNTDKK